MAQIGNDLQLTIETGRRQLKILDLQRNELGRGSVPQMLLRGETAIELWPRLEP